MERKFEIHACFSTYNLLFGHPSQTHTQKTSVKESKAQRKLIHSRVWTRLAIWVSLTHWCYAPFLSPVCKSFTKLGHPNR